MKQLALLIATSFALTGNTFAGSDPLETPARLSELAKAQLITSLAHVDEHAIVGVGQRGHILRSDDGGKRWSQARVPVSSDLAAVQFVNAKTGYAVGHDGVVLRSDDGGATWAKLLDGRAANDLLLKHMQKIVEAGGGEDARRLFEEAKRNVEAGPDKPFLDLWFANSNDGFIVGAYNLIFHTDDGGKTWQPWFDRTDNPKLLNLYAIRPSGGALYIAGEGGLLLKLDVAAQRFKALSSPYNGTFFGLVGLRAGVLAFGMRANAFVSRDEGRTWQPVKTGLVASITAGDAKPNGSVVLVDQAGNVAVSHDGGESFSNVPVQPPMPLAAVTFAGDGFVTGGVHGLRALDSSKDK